MDATLVLDLLVVLTLLGALVGGWRRGIGRTVGGLAGAVAGLAAALALMPWLGDRLEDTTTRGPLLAVAAVAAVVGGLVVGQSLGGLLRRALGALRLTWLDSAAGSLGSAVLVGVAWVVAAANVSVVGSSGLTDAVHGSRGVETLSRVAPDGLREATSADRLRQRGAPWLADVVGEPLTPPAIPDVDVDTAAVRQATGSVVRVSGAARGCAGVVTGSGVMIAPDRVMTNAHVVGGVDEPTVRAPGVGSSTGRVVYVDERNDLAVIATDGLDVPALPVSERVRRGDRGVVAGYPGGGPLTLVPAEVVSQRRTVVTNGDGASTRAVLTLAADVERGNSGGPVLDRSGQVAGIVFGKSSGVEDVGFAAPLSVVGPLVDRSAGLTDRVDTGRCRAA